MQAEEVKSFLLEAFTEGVSRKGQEFIPLHCGVPDAPALKEPASTDEEEARRVFEEAYVEGEKAGFEMGMRKVEPLVERLNRYMTEFESYQKSLTEKAESLAFGLAIAFAETLVLKECALHQETLLRMIKKALELCEQKSKKIIRIRPEDSKFIETQSPGWTVVPDDTLREPGFIIETDFGDVDGMVSTQLEELKREFLMDPESRYTPGAEGREP